MTVVLLDNPVQSYSWGRIGGIDRLVGRPPAASVQAELWVGTHPRGPSRIVGDGPAGPSLLEVVGGHLPFLLKVLAIGEPLSLQVHPSADQAAAGYAREEAAGIPIDAPERTYPDPSPKPEVLVALEVTDALCGFRQPGDAYRQLEGLGADALAPLCDRLAAPGPPARRVQDAFAWLVHLPDPERRAVAEAAAAAAGPTSASPIEPRQWVAHLAEQHPGDPMCVAPLLLELVRLGPGDAVHLPAGYVHAYLRGAGVEVMASSDNVLRAGLTPKHVDGDELLSVVRFEPGVPGPPVRKRHGAVTTYEVDEAAFSLAQIDASSAPCTIEVVEPSLLLPVHGGARIVAADATVEVAPGQGAYVAGGSTVSVSSTASVWWASTGRGMPR